MKEWIRDGLIGWAGGILVLTIAFTFMSTALGTVLMKIIYSFIQSLFLAVVPGFGGGILGGKYFKFKWSNAAGGVVFSLLLLLLF